MEIFEFQLSKADLVLIAYDLSSKQSFEEAKTWHDRLKKANGGSVKGALVATKLDLK